MDDAELLEALRTARFPNRWVEAGTWTKGLVSWHVHTHPDSWAGIAGTFQEEAVTWVEAIIACALHHAGVKDVPLPPDGPLEPHAPLLATVLADAAALLTDARTAVDTITSAQVRAVRTARPLPADLVEALAPILASVPYQLEHGNTEIKVRVLHFIGVARQVLQDHADAGRTLEDRLPAMVRSSAMDIAFDAEPPAQGLYAGALSYSQHLLAVANLDATHDLAQLQGEPPEKDWQRNRLLQRAALADRWLLLWGADDRPQQRVDQAHVFAAALLNWDTEHETGTGGWGDFGPEDDLAPYVRGQYAAWIEHTNQPLFS
ncbi:hypothetical protein P3T35_000477 [Kitasatospora sp. GP30]|uniref:hypothetical protein n=1 Tax=Kitasatospora sp. GP30 TaxID=3035084 RepID=UPI000C70AF93|nr:hypothetical protein [Kitasatospora sp. GP30]MDH6138500.1 hypothetical protein [Kitasatospora sp. GP30]